MWQPPLTDRKHEHQDNCTITISYRDSFIRLVLVAMLSRPSSFTCVSRSIDVYVTVGGPTMPSPFHDVIWPTDTCLLGRRRPAGRACTCSCCRLAYMNIGRRVGICGLNFRVYQRTKSRAQQSLNPRND